jgi:hypothetical protein
VLAPRGNIVVTSPLFARCIGVLLLFSCTTAQATTIAPPSTVEQLAGAWIGPDSQTAYFRLEVDKTGHGLLVIQEDSDNGHISQYNISATSLSGYRVSFTLLPLNGADPIELSGKESPGILSLVRSGLNHGHKWHTNVSLEREDYLLPRIQAVKEASTTSH